MENQDGEDENALSKTTNTLTTFKKFQDIYSEQLKETDDSWVGLKLKVKVLESWVKDLTEQNVMLMKAVGNLEGEALECISAMEANISSKPQSDDPRIKYLCNDIRNLLELLRRLREEGFWYLDGLIFKTVTYEDIFGRLPWTCCCKSSHCLGKSRRWKVTVSSHCFSSYNSKLCCCCSQP